MPSTLFHRTGASTTLNRHGSGTGLNPHWVSENGKPVIIRITTLKILPAYSRPAGWWTPIKERSSAREPMATAASALFTAEVSLSISLIGDERWSAP